MYGLFGKVMGPVAVGIFTACNEVFKSLRSGVLALAVMFCMAMIVLKTCSFEQAALDSAKFAEEAATPEQGISITDCGDQAEV